MALHRLIIAQLTQFTLNGVDLRLRQGKGSLRSPIKSKPAGS